jgi:glycosyltransferase involved in cell wall biosynthesis
MTEDGDRPDGWRPLRIAMTSYYLPSESKIGAGHQAHAMAQALVDRGHEVMMFSPCAPVEGARYDHSQVLMHGPLRTFRWANRVRALDLRGFDVLHSHGDNHLRLRRSPPVIRTMHGSCFAEARHIHGAKERLRMFALGLTEVIGSLTATTTVAVSRNTRRYYPWINRVIPNGVDLDLFHPGEKEPTPTILFVGTYGQRKRGWLLMEAFDKEIQPHLPDAKLWMVCTDAPDAPGVEVLGRLSDEELADRYRRAWVFCLPSTYEGFGVPYIEALASGTAVVATPNAGAVEVLEEGRRGCVTSDSQLSSSLMRLLTEGDERGRLGCAGRDTVERYSWEEVIRQYESTYSEAGADHRR